MRVIGYRKTKYTKCLELGLDVDAEYTEVVQQRKDARARIQALTFPSISSIITQKETLYGSI